MPTKLRREDNIDEAYDYAPGAKNLKDAETSTDDSYANAGIDQLEAYANDPTNASRDTVEAKEADTNSAGGGWTVNRSGAGQAPSGQNRAVKILKKGSPVGVLLAALLAVAGLVSFFGGPGLLIVNLAEKMTEKFNYQLTSMDIRTNKIMIAKIKNTTTGCAKFAPVKCKFASFSEREIANLKKAGIEVVPDEAATKSLLTGRVKAKSLVYEGKTILPNEFEAALKKPNGFSTALRNGYNPKFAGVSDAIAAKTLARLKTSKRAPLPDDAANDDERMKAVQEQTKNGQTGSTGTTHTVGEKKDPSCTGSNCETYTQADIDAEKAAIERTGAIGEEASKVDAEDSKAASRVLAELEDSGFDAVNKATNAIKITGLSDDACTVYGMMKAVSIAAKTVRKAQLARFAMMFLTTASQIKAGEAKPEDVSFFGTILTTTLVSTAANGTKKTTLPATDSFGYRYAAFGDKGINEAATPFLVGGGLTGTLSKVTAAITSIIGGPKAADKTCGTLANPFVQIGSFIGGLALMIIPGGQALSAAKIGGQLLFAAVTFAAQMLLPALLADIIAGKLVDKNTVGEAAGNAITAGSGVIMSDMALTGGNAPLTRDQAKQMVSVNEEVRLSYAAYERETRSPLDITSPHTFLGSIASGMMPYIHGGDRTIFGTIKNIASMPTSSMKNFITTPVSAAETENFDECTDIEYDNLNLATDPFCNIVSGIPSASMNDDPNIINDRLLAKDLIDATSGEPKGAYADFVNNCMNRKDPLGSTGQDSTGTTGEECILDPADQTKGDMYTHFVDMRVNDGMENELPVRTAGSSEPTDPTSDPGSGSGPVDTSKLTDPTIQCPAGTKDLGTVKTRYAGTWPIKTAPYPTIRLCQLSSIPGGGQTTTGNGTYAGAVVNAGAAANFDSMAIAAKAAGIKLVATSSFRLADSCGGGSSGGLCAAPGQSLHQLGVAIDFALIDPKHVPGATCASGRSTSIDPVYKWLRANGPSKYGVLQYAQENWHWQAAPEQFNSCM